VSWHGAPLYVAAHDLARDVSARTEGWEQRGLPLALSDRLVGAALELLCTLGCALTFPASRAADLLAADRALVSLRLQLRIARELGALSPGGARHLEGRMLEIGRMIGGWRKRVQSARGRRTPGDGLPPARTA